MNDPTHFPYHLNLSRQIPNDMEFIAVINGIIPVKHPMFLNLGESIKAFVAINDFYSPDNNPTEPTAA